MTKQIICRRVVTPLLILAVCMSFMVVPAKAAEVDDNSFLNVLDYSSLNQNGNRVDIQAGSNRLTFKLPSQHIISYFDIVITSYTRPDFFYLDNQGHGLISLNIVSIGSGLFRVYGSAPAWLYNELTFVVESSSSSWIQFEQLYVLTAFESSQFFTVSSGYIQSLEINEEIYRDPSNPNPAYWQGIYGNSVDTEFTLTVVSPSWKNFDYLDYQLYFQCKDITSISCSYGDSIIPVDVSYVDNASEPKERFYISVRIDLRGIRRDKVDKNGVPLLPQLKVTGNFFPNHFAKIQIVNSSGFVVMNDVNPIYSYFRKLGLDLNVWFSNLVSEIRSGVDSIVDAIFAVNSEDQDDQMSDAASQATEMDDLLGELDEVTKPSLDELPADIDDIIDGNAVSLATGGLAAIMVNPVLNPLFTLALIFSTAAYVLFGKR